MMMVRCHRVIKLVFLISNTTAVHHDIKKIKEGLSMFLSDMCSIGAFCDG